MSSPLIGRLARWLGTSGTRRQMLVTGGKRTVAGLGTAFVARSIWTSLFDGERAIARQGVPYTRPDVHSSEAKLESYALAVKNMKALDADDPRSWSYQANIHGTLLPQSQWLDLFYTCEHHTDHFWPWHRMYLYWFEQIVRDQSGNPDFALPYWDYSDPTKQYLPEPFRAIDNPLYVGRRSNDASSEMHRVCRSTTLCSTTATALRSHHSDFSPTPAHRSVWRVTSTIPFTLGSEATLLLDHRA